jgi:hypothetical protein
LTISNFRISGAYTQTNNCPATLASGSSCAINIVFSPTSSGTQSHCQKWRIRHLLALDFPCRWIVLECSEPEL